MNRIVRCCVGRPVSIVMALSALLLLGVKASINLPLRGYPDVSVPRVMVGLRMPGLPAAEMSTLVVSPLEDALASAKGLLRTSSIAHDGQALISLDFSWGNSPLRASARVRDIIDSAYPSLPDGLARPSVLPYNPDDEPLLIVALAPKSGELWFARRMAEYDVATRLRRVEGVGAVQLVGGQDREIVVQVDTGKAAARGMTVSDVAIAMASEHADMPAGSIREGDKELVALVRGRATSSAELAEIQAIGPGGTFRLSDLATVRERDADRKSLFLAKGEECVALEVYLSPGADPVGTARRLRGVVQDASSHFEGSLAMHVVRDGSMAVAESLKGLAYAALIGALAAAFVLFATLRDPRAAMLVALTIPLSIASSLSVLLLFGRSLNCMSLGGMTLAIGMISDHAVVVIDALSSRFCQHAHRPTSDSIAMCVDTVVCGTFGSMATTSIVFIPVFFLPGPLGALFGDMALALISASVSGWLIAVLALPSAYRILWTRTSADDFGVPRRWYRKALSWAFRRPIVCILVAALATIGGFFLVITRPLSCMPPEAAVELRLVAEFAPGSSLEGFATRAKALCKALSSLKGIESVHASAGAEDNDIVRLSDPGFAPETLSVRCMLDGKATANELLYTIKICANTMLPGNASCLVDAPPDRVASILGLGKGFSIAVRGESRAHVNDAADRVESTLRGLAMDSLSTLSRNPGSKKPRICMTPCREVQAAMGLSLLDTVRVVRTASEGVAISSITIDGRDIGLRVLASLNEGPSYELSRLEAIPLRTSSGASIPASTVLRFRPTEDEASVARLDRADVIYIEARAVEGRDSKLASAIATTLNTHPEALRPDRSAFNEYAVAMFGSLALVIILLYLTLGSQFESFIMPLLIMATIPLAIAGVGPALVLTGLGLDAGSILGLIVLFGTVVNNAILLHEATVLNKNQGLKGIMAAYIGASNRLRPILATSLTTVVALLPVCLSHRASVQGSMAIAMIGGLLASTAMTLFISPMALAWNAMKREKKVS